MKYTTQQRQKGTLFGKPRSSVIKAPGSFSSAARQAGLSTSAFASKELAPDSEASTLMKRRANLANVFAKMRAKKAQG